MFSGDVPGVPIFSRCLVFHWQLRSELALFYRKQSHGWWIDFPATAPFGQVPPFTGKLDTVFCYFRKDGTKWTSAIHGCFPRAYLSSIDSRVFCTNQAKIFQWKQNSCSIVSVSGNKQPGPLLLFLCFKHFIFDIFATRKSKKIDIAMKNATAYHKRRERAISRLFTSWHVFTLPLSYPQAKLYNSICNV